ncbi:MAG: hypothetical protein F6K19_19220 [Cyanothece sp. SIO1E1]|nr:hypothetical protein [Cyanothece sp. SIO1E1]
MHITLVQKIKLDGQPCAKSTRVLNELEELGLLQRINQVIAADEREPASEGFALAKQHSIAAAPFFIVNEGDSTRIYEAYHRFLDEVFNRKTSEAAEISEIMAQNPELDFI